MIGPAYCSLSGRNCNPVYIQLEAAVVVKNVQRVLADYWVGWAEDSSCLKPSRDVASVTEVGKPFHSRIVGGKKDFL